MEEWVYEFEGNTILVRNAKVVELVINGDVQDSIKGIRLKAELNGTLPSGKAVRATLGGFAEVECSLYVDDVVLTPTTVPKR